MSDARSTSSSTSPLDCLADALDDAALEAEAAAAGEDIAGAASVLRAHFLARVAAARDRAGHLPFAATMAGNCKNGASPAADAEHLEGDEAPPTIGRYPILRRLGAGGMGVVYAAYDEVLDRKVAIKVLRPSVIDVDGRRRDRLLREAQAMARITHPNVVTVHDVGTTGDQIFVAMEFVAGATVQEWLAAEERPWQEIVAVFRQAADGLAALHDAGLVHRDVKPSNMILGEDGRLRVLDLGLVGTEPRELGDTLESGGVSSSVNRLDVPLTITGERVGTPAYMSREQFLGLPLTPASDIFALSIALYEALHGVHPFMAASYAELQGNVLYGRVREPVDPSAIPGWLHALVVSGLAIDPADRPPTMQAYGAALAGPRRKHRRWLGTLGIAAVATFGGVAITWSQSAPSELTCDGGEVLIQTVWGPERAEAIRRAMVATGRPYADDLADRVRETLTTYSARWADAHRRACREYSRGDHSDALYDARIACLDRR
ncbi:MAG: serine/threonine protein kinase, partial [Myxococcales bacterium]|nr:serine/threonine protein kinase [Myxococcales bacterium]